MMEFMKLIQVKINWALVGTQHKKKKKKKKKSFI